MSSPSLVYEDEILPEIEVRELLTLEEVLRDNPTFIAFTRDEMIEHIYNLVGDMQKTTTFVSSIFDYNTPHAPNDNIIPVLQATRRNNSDLDEQLDRFQDIMRAPDYKLQQSLLSFFQYPLEQVLPTTEGQGFIPHKKTLVGIAGSMNDTTIVLPTDNAVQALYGAAYLLPNVTKESYLFERAHATTPQYKSTEVVQTTDLDSVHPSFDQVVATLTEVPDIHELRLQLSKYGYDLLHLTQDQVATLVRKIQELPMPREEKDKKGKKHASIVGPIQWRDFYKALEQLPMPSLDKEKYRVIYDAFTASLPPQTANVDIPMDGSQILEGLRSGRFSFDEVVNFLKMMRNKFILDESFAALKRYMDINPDEIPDNIQSIVNKWARRLDKYEDRTAKVFLSLYQDMAEVKKGNDTSMYDGNPSQESQQVFEETENDYVADNDDEDDDVPLQETSHSIDNSMFEGYSDGVKEVVIPIVRKLHKLSSTSGVSFNLPDMVKFVAPRIVRISFQETLVQALPDLAQDIRNQLAAGNSDAALRISSTIVPSELGMRTRDVVKRMYKEYRDVLRTAFLTSLAWVVLDTQRLAMDKQLAFDPMSGMLSCIQVWSPFGPPLVKESSRNPEGVVYYLACVAEDTHIVDEFGWKSEDIVKHVLEFVHEHMSETVSQLKEQWLVYSKENTQTSNKAKQANISLAEAIEQKLKKRILTDFVRAFLYIPGMLSAAKHPSYAVGCCMQHLGPEFHADSDWKELKKLKAVKDQFAKKRMTRTDRPELGWLQAEERVAKAQTVLSYIIPTIEETSVHTTVTLWLELARDLNMSLLPPAMVDTFIHDPSSVDGVVAANIRMAFKTAQKRAPNVETFILKEASVEDLQRLLNRIAVVLSAQSVIYKDQHMENMYLQGSLQQIHLFKETLQKLDGKYDQIDAATLLHVLRYVVSRAMCLPANPEDAHGDKLFLTEMVDASFLSKVLKNVVDTVFSTVQTAAMPSWEDQQNFITKMRELQKVETLKVLNSQTEDDRQVIVEAKKLGLYKTTFTRPDDDGDTTNTAQDYDYDQEGENEFRYGGQNRDDNDLDDLN
jgi:hypothetical protein